MRVAAAMGKVSAAILLMVVQPVVGQQLTMTSHTLANGMQVIVHPDGDVPNVAMHLFFKVGSRNERPGVTGISHFFEHMMFNGAAKYGPKQFDVQMEKNGGRNNAYTTRDMTVYTDWFPAGALELMFDMEADRIRDLTLDAAMIERERGVVYSERRTSVDNDNEGTLEEQLAAAAYTAHPYGWPVIGWASDIGAWTMEDLRQHYRMGYAPNNCVVVVSGDVDEARVLELAKKYFEPIPRQEPPPAVRTREPAQQGERRVLVRRPAQLALVMVSYHIPASNHADRVPLEVLSAILVEGRSSRLYRSLVDLEELALSVEGGREESLDPGQFRLTLQVRDGVEPEDVEESLYEELDEVRSRGVSAQELEKARNQLLVGYYRDMKTIAGKANRIGQAELLLGDYRRWIDYPKELAAVTAGDVQRVARAYLGEDNRTVAVLIPDEGRDTR